MSAGCFKKNCTSTHEVLYPLQTHFLKLIDYIPKIPWLKEIIKKPVHRIVNLPEYCPSTRHLLDAERLHYQYVAGVFVGNFTNHLYAIAEKKFCEQGKKITFKLCYR